jgi:hypothetical protein
MSTTAELQAANEQLRSAVEGRHVQAAEAACCEETTIPPDWILRGEQELKQRELPPVYLIGDSLLKDETSPAEQLLDKAMQTVAQRRQTYGPPTEHFRKTVGMINAAFSEVLKRPLTEGDWAIIMMLDKIARDQGPTPTDDTPIDMAGYAACLAECRHTA